MKNNMTINCSNLPCVRLRGLIMSTCKAYLLLSLTIGFKNSLVKMSLNNSIGSWGINRPDSGVPVKGISLITTCSESAVSHFSLNYFLVHYYLKVNHLLNLKPHHFHYQHHFLLVSLNQNFSCCLQLLKFHHQNLKVGHFLQICLDVR